MVKSLPVTPHLWEQHNWSPGNGFALRGCIFSSLGSWAENHFHAKATKVPLQKSRGAHPRSWVFLFVWFGLVFFGYFRAAPETYRNSQARGRIRATAAGLYHSHSNSGSEPCLQPTLQLSSQSPLARLTQHDPPNRKEVPGSTV